MDGYPVTALGRDDRKRLLDLTRCCARAVRLLPLPRPTSVGKTDLAKALAEELFSNEKALVRIDMYYYRRTYKDNMNCPATNQVQQKDHSDPPLYAVTYYNEHSCNSTFLTLSPSEFQLQTSSGKVVSICFNSSSGPAAQQPLSAAAATATNASGGSPSSSAATRRGTPSRSATHPCYGATRHAPKISNPPMLRRSETYPWVVGAVEQKPASCSTKSHVAFPASASAVPEEVVDAGRFGSIRAPGYENGGQLTEQEMRRPYSVILDDGRLTDAKGRAVDFTNTIIIMTSNLGAHHLDGYPDNDAARERILADVRRHFRPELVNRLDEMVVFQPLSSSSAGDQLLRKVARLQLKGVALRLAGKGIDLDVTDAALDVMLSETRGEVKMYGARPIRRFVQKVVVTRISNMVVREEVHEDCCISIDADEEVKELVFTVTKKPADQKK
ncbi:hypothetical protein SETIT_9G134400v2 [Setaria italica]|uniref:WRKY domain-containing protein n=1 Tax=Setaria italica TaxID=4555 RepID=A0A368SG61_SETIT|nr:hypothetical protein SETIT_9G134400v2 [Setaria italica]